LRSVCHLDYLYPAKYLGKKISYIKTNGLDFTLIKEDGYTLSQVLPVSGAERDGFIAFFQLNFQSDYGMNHYFTPMFSGYL